MGGWAVKGSQDESPERPPLLEKYPPASSGLWAVAAAGMEISKYIGRNSLRLFRLLSRQK